MFGRKSSQQRSDILTCPRCGKQFSKMYARTFACQGCSQSYYQCGHVRCPYCGHEF